jgi:hypothetical protein
MQSSFDGLSLTGFPQPEWNNARSVSDALRATQSASTKEASSSAYDKLLYALGNNHAGTYYPVALVAVPALETILREGQFWAKSAALNVLIELCGSFEPEPEFEVFNGESLSSVLLQKVAAFLPVIEGLAATTDVIGRSASDLVDAMRDVS